MTASETIMLIGVDPKVDYAFKRVFGHEKNTDILCSLLNAVLQSPPDHLELHLIELPKFDRPLAEVATDLDRWLFFLRHGAELDLANWPAQLTEPTLQHAAKELHMLTQDDIQRERYEARMKGLMDYRSELNAERQEGIAEGIAEGIVRGQVIGQIQMLQALLHDPQTPADDLRALSEESLTQMRLQLLEAARRVGLPV
jgi:flagellar biosynthesis/type III secretory pathway protein FliH